MLNARETEKVADVYVSRLDQLKQRGQLPFKDLNKPFAPQRFSPFHALALNLQA